VKNAEITFCTAVFTDFCTPSGEDALRNQELEPKPWSKISRGKITKSGGSDPTFRAFSRPKSFWSRSRPFAHSIALVIFPRLGTDFESRKKGQPPCH
jgi:hypothetical protein